MNLLNMWLRASEWRQVCAHLSSHDGFEGYAGDEVGPDDVQHLQHQQQRVEEPPGRVRPDDLPALEESCSESCNNKTLHLI